MTCPVCASALSRTTLSTEQGGLSLCGACSHAFQTDLTVTADYAVGYAERTYDTYPETTAYLRAGFILGRVPIEERERVIDVGYGNGSLLRVMRAAGSDILGIDVHGRDYGIPETTFAQAPRAGVVTFFDSLEHLPDLAAVGLMRCGHMFVSVPHRPSWFESHFREWRHFKPGEHLHYFSSGSLRALMRRFGYSCINESAVEDAVRGRYDHAKFGPSDNIHTYHFRHFL